MSPVNIDERMRDRYALLRCLYDMCDGHMYRFVCIRDAARGLAFEERYAVDLATYLWKAGLLEEMTTDECCSISAVGINEVERAVSTPNNPTRFFQPRHFVINYGTVQVQNVQGSGNIASQTSNVASLDLHALQSVLTEILTRIGDLATTKKDQMRVEADARSAFEQTKSPEPDTNIIRTLVNKMVATLKAIGTPLAVELAKKLLGLS